MRAALTCSSFILQLEIFILRQFSVVLEFRQSENHLPQNARLFERKEVKDTLAYLKAALNRDSISDFKRAISFPSRGIGKVTLLKVLEGKTEELPKGAKEKIKQFEQLLETIKEHAETKKPSENKFKWVP